jgi:hypothetical protein
MRYASNIIAMESNSVPPEGPLDVAMTNGLAAIVASVDISKVKNPKGQMLSARDLIKVASSLGVPIGTTELLSALEVTQPMRHGRADDEWVAPTAEHFTAIRELDAHPALQVLDLARRARNVDELLVELYRQAAEEVSGGPAAYDDDAGPHLEPEECDECWRMTFLPDGLDFFGGTNTTGICVACGHERDADTAYEHALNVEWERWSERDQ